MPKHTPPSGAVLLSSTLRAPQVAIAGARARLLRRLQSALIAAQELEALGYALDQTLDSKAGPLACYVAATICRAQDSAYQINPLKAPSGIVAVSKPSRRRRTPIARAA